MIQIPHPNLPTLSAAIRLESPSNRGMCFHRSVALSLDLEGSEVVLATFRGSTPAEIQENPARSTTPFIHAWVEWDGLVLAPTTIEEIGGLAAFRPEEYYAIHEAKDFRRLARAAVLRHVADEMVLKHLLYGADTPVGYLVDRLLKAVGLAYRVSPIGGVLPATTKGE